MYRAGADADCLGHHRRRPMGDLTRRIAQRLRHRLLVQRSRQRRDARSSGLVVQQPVDPLRHETLLPAPYGDLALAGLPHDRVGPDTICRQQHDACAPHMLLSAVPIRDDRLQMRTIGAAHFNRDPLAHARSPSLAEHTLVRDSYVRFNPLDLCGGTFGIIRTYDGNSFHFGAMRGVPPEIAELMKQPRRPPFTGMVALERIVAGEPVVEIRDSRDLAGYRAGVPTIQAMVDRGGARTGLWVALRKEAELLGFIWVYRQEIRPFTDRQIALLRNFANQAVIAIENARLLTETREALEQQTATAEVLQVINSSPGNLTPVYEAMLEKARILCGAAHGSLSLYDGEKFRSVAINTQSQELADRLRQGFSPSEVQYLKPLLDGARLVHVPDLAELGQPYGARTALFVPLRKHDALLGLISNVRLEIRPFSDKEIALVENFAAQAIIAMENARLLTETREALEQQTATAEVL